jgi:xylan 1,4-beta-xylosidase
MIFRRRLTVTAGLVVAIIGGVIAGTAREPGAVEVRVDAEKAIGRLDSRLWANIGYDPMYWATVQEEALPFWRKVRETQALRYIRMHNTFSDGFAVWGLASGDLRYCGGRVYSEDASGKPRYEFAHLDEVLDIVVSAGMRPILEMDFMPDALAEGAPVRNYCGGMVNTPKDYEKWRNLIYETARHLEARYGAGEVREWYFEIWNEPDLKTYFIDGLERGVRFTPERVARLNKMYDYFAEGAKAADPQIRVGGPGIAGNPDYFRGFLKHITAEKNAATGRTGAPADFVSWHHYGTLESHLERNRFFRGIIASEFPLLAALEVHQNEWGQGLRRGARVEAPSVYGLPDALLLVQMIDETLKRNESRVDLFLRWGQPIGTLARGRFFGWRALSVVSGDAFVPLPILNAYLMLAKMGPERVGFRADGGVSGFAARSSPSDVQVLIYRAEETGDEKEVTVSVSLPRAITVATVTVYQMDEARANAYAAWEKAGGDTAFGAETIRAIASAADLKPGRSRAKVTNGVLRHTLRLQPSAIALVVVGKEYVRTFHPLPHIQRVMDAENAYLEAKRAQSGGKQSAAKSALEKVAAENSDLIWGRRAWFRLLGIAEAKDAPEEAAGIRARLLIMPLNDTERLVLLRAQSGYFKGIGRSAEVQRMTAEADALAAKIERLKCCYAPRP